MVKFMISTTTNKGTSDMARKAAAKSKVVTGRKGHVSEKFIVMIAALGLAIVTIVGYVVLTASEQKSADAATSAVPCDKNYNYARKFSSVLLDSSGRQGPARLDTYHHKTATNPTLVCVILVSTGSSVGIPKYMSLKFYNTDNFLFFNDTSSDYKHYAGPLYAKKTTGRLIATVKWQGVTYQRVQKSNSY